LASQQPVGQVVGEHGAVVWHWPFLALQVWPPWQATQVWPFVPQACSVSPGWHSPLWSQQPCGQFCCEQVALPWHWPLALHVWPGAHSPHVPWLPQPSSPHCRPPQFGAQHKALVALH
jgi:hypothetical protein